MAKGSASTKAGSSKRGRGGRRGGGPRKLEKDRRHEDFSRPESAIDSVNGEGVGDEEEGSDNGTYTHVISSVDGAFI